MKRKTRFKKLMLSFLVFTFSTAIAFGQTCGDVNADEVTDIVDALLVAQCYVGITSCPSAEIGDVNCDEYVDIVDALLIAQFYVGLINNIDCCETPTDVPTDPPGVDVSLEMQAEDGSWSSGGVESDHSGYTGSGYVNTDNATDEWVEWTIDVERDCNARCVFTYAVSGSDRSMDLSVNGNVQISVSFPDTGAWTTWETGTGDIILRTGPNAIRLTATNSDGAPNIDKIDITIYGGGVVTPTPVISPTPTPTSDPNDTPGPTAPPGSGNISIHDEVPGWASMDGGTTGGGTDLSNAVTVRSMSELQNHAAGTDRKIILVEPGTYNGALLIGANKTIIGTEPGVLIRGYIQMRADKADASGNKQTHNIIIRNISVQGDRCSSMDECRNGDDAVYMGYGAHHIWLDHMDVYDGQDGNLDATRGADYMTISWCKFRYTYDKEHCFSNIIAGSDSESESVGKLKMTYMKCWWGERVEQRQPRGRFGDVHCFNNYHSSKANQNGKLYAIGPGYDMAIIVENCHFDMTSDAKAIKLESYPGWRGVLARGNIGQSKSGYPMNCDEGTVFAIPYQYDLIDANQVKNVVTAGAGTTCVFIQ